MITAQDPGTHSVPAGTKRFVGKDQVNKQETHIPSPRARHEATKQARWWIRQKPQAVREGFPHINWKQKYPGHSSDSPCLHLGPFNLTSVSESLVSRITEAQLPEETLHLQRTSPVVLC